MRERGGAIGGLLAAIGLLVVLMAIAFAVCVGTTGASQSRSLGRIHLVSHRYDDGGDCDWNGDCGDDYGGNRYGGEGNHNDNRRCRGDQCRGSFSPGPFDRSPIEMHDVCVSLDCSGREKKHKDDKPPPDESPQSLFPPSVDGVKAFVLQTIQSGLELGRVFSDTTITFVGNLLVGIA